MARRTREQILSDKLKRLEEQREDRINRYIIPIEIKMEETREQIRAMYLKKGIKCDG
jgi:hypothetical protein